MSATKQFLKFQTRAGQRIEGRFLREEVGFVFVFVTSGPLELWGYEVPFAKSDMRGLLVSKVGA
jgi:hypothetical protein